MIRNRGMTLLEVMMALAVFAIAGMSLIEMTSADLNNLHYLEQKTVASWVAQNELAGYRLTQKLPTSSWYESKVKMVGSEWYVRSRSQSAGDEKQGSFSRVEVEVKSSEDAKQALINLRSYFAQ